MADPGLVLSQLPSLIDISCVQATHTLDDVRELAGTAREYGFVSAHVLPNRVEELRGLLAGCSTRVGAPVGFPSGGSTTSSKKQEVTELLALGADEIDVVVNIGRLRSGDSSYVTDELGVISSLVQDAATLRAIIEVGHLTDAEIRQACRCIVAAGVPWVKTATGWSGKVTTTEHVAVIASEVSGRASIKAAGGIRSVDTLTAMAALGVTRFGMNLAAAVAVVDGSNAIGRQEGR